MRIVALTDTVKPNTVCPRRDEALLLHQTNRPQLLASNLMADLQSLSCWSTRGLAGMFQPFLKHSAWWSMLDLWLEMNDNMASFEGR